MGITHIIEDNEIDATVLKDLYNRMVERLVGDGQVQLAGGKAGPHSGVLPTRLHVSIDCAYSTVVPVLGLLSDTLQIQLEGVEEMLFRLRRCYSTTARPEATYFL